MPAQPKSHRFEAEPECWLHCLEWGPSSESTTEPPLIFLHGGGANAHWWDHLAPRISWGGPIYALDFRGHGDSTFTEETRVGAFNDDLEAMLRWLGREDVLLVGHSLGAAVALDHASRFPATRGIALIDLARGSTRTSGRRARLALSLRRTYRSRQEAIDRFRFLPESSHAREALRRAIAENSVQEEVVARKGDDGETTIRYGYKFDPRWFGLPSRPRPDLSRIGCPTLLIRGAESELLSVSAAEDFAEAVAGARFVEVADAGHHVLVDQPDALLEVLQGFVEMALDDSV